MAEDSGGLFIGGEKPFGRIKEKRCAFLEPDNLCSMYTELGAKGLCRTCRLYPRHVEEFEGVREITLSVSCPGGSKDFIGKRRTGMLSYL